MKKTVQANKLPNDIKTFGFNIINVIGFIDLFTESSI